MGQIWPMGRILPFPAVGIHLTLLLWKIFLPAQKDFDSFITAVEMIWPYHNIATGKIHNLWAREFVDSNKVWFVKNKSELSVFYIFSEWQMPQKGQNRFLRIISVPSFSHLYWEKQLQSFCSLLHYRLSWKVLSYNHDGEGNCFSCKRIFSF